MTRSATALMSLTAPGQTAVVTADFGPMLAAGATIVAVALVSMTVWPNSSHPAQDPDVTARVLGAPQIVASQKTGVANGAIAQKVGNFLPNVRYAITIAGTASDGTEPELWQYMTADYPGMPGS
ncbi:MAG: hypothetical protein ACREFO_10290 [Acetobacteraceae bacterium]